MLRCSVCQGTINELNLGLDKNEEALAKEVSDFLRDRSKEVSDEGGQGSRFG